jgi:hypothetical protein
MALAPDGNRVRRPCLCQAGGTGPCSQDCSGPLNSPDTNGEVESNWRSHGSGRRADGLLTPKECQTPQLPLAHVE